MPTTAVDVTAAYTAVVAGPIGIGLQCVSPWPVEYVVIATGTEDAADIGHFLSHELMHPVYIPTGSTVYARALGPANGRPARVVYSEIPYEEPA